MNRFAARLLTPGLLLTFTLYGCSAKRSPVEQVKLSGGTVAIDRKSPDQAVIGVNLAKADLTDDWLEHLEGFTKLRSLNLAQTNVTDAGLEHLKGLTQLQSLDLRETKVDDAGLERLQGFVELQALDLTQTNVSDAGLDRLKGLPRLQSLNLARCACQRRGVGASPRVEPTHGFAPCLHPYYGRWTDLLPRVAGHSLRGSAPIAGTGGNQDQRRGTGTPRRFDQSSIPVLVQHHDNRRRAGAPQDIDQPSSAGPGKNQRHRSRHENPSKGVAELPHPALNFRILSIFSGLS